MPAITLTAGLSGGSVGYARSGSGAYAPFGSISAQPLAGYTLDYLDAANGSGYYVVGFVGNTVGTLPISSFTVNGNLWTLGSGTYQSGFGSTQYPLTITTGAGLSNGVAYTVDMSGDPVITSPNTNTNAIGTTLAHALTANESVSWSIVGGADQALFEISGSTLRWVSNGVSGSTGAKVVTVRATAADNGATVDQTITITVYVPYTGPTHAAVTAGTASAAAITGFSVTGIRGVGRRMFLGVMTANQAMATPSGWNLFVPDSGTPSRGTAATAGGVRMTVFWKDSDGTETTVDFADSGDIQYVVGWSAAKDAGASGIDFGPSVAGNSTGTAGSFPGVTTLDDNSLQVTFVASDRDAAAANWSGQAGGNLANLTERFDNGTSTGTGGGVAIFTGEKQAAGATGTFTATHAGNVGYAYITLTLKNAGSAPAATPYSFGFVA